MTESSLCECKRNLAPYVVALALEYLVLFDIHIYMQIACRTAVLAAVAVTADIEYLILADAGRYCYGNSAL